MTFVRLGRPRRRRSLTSRRPRQRACRSEFWTLVRLTPAKAIASIGRLQVPPLLALAGNDAENSQLGERERGGDLRRDSAAHGLSPAWIGL
jgi:hypothetical protein